MNKLYLLIDRLQINFDKVMSKDGLHDFACSLLEDDNIKWSDNKDLMKLYNLQRLGKYKELSQYIKDVINNNGYDIYEFEDTINLLEDYTLLINDKYKNRI